MLSLFTRRRRRDAKGAAGGDGAETLRHRKRSSLATSAVTADGLRQSDHEGIEVQMRAMLTAQGMDAAAAEKVMQLSVRLQQFEPGTSRSSC